MIAMRLPTVGLTRPFRLAALARKARIAMRMTRPRPRRKPIKAGDILCEYVLDLINSIIDRQTFCDCLSIK